MYSNNMLGKQQSLTPKKTDFNDKKLNAAKQYPIENLYSGDTKKTGKVIMGRCPFHEEDTASFAMYPKTNTFYCFGCREGGDVIKFYMKINNVDFQEALEALAG